MTHMGILYFQFFQEWIKKSAFFANIISVLRDIA